MICSLFCTLVFQKMARILVDLSSKYSLSTALHEPSFIHLSKGIKDKNSDIACILFLLGELNFTMFLDLHAYVTNNCFGFSSDSCSL